MGISCSQVMGKAVMLKGVWLKMSYLWFETLTEVTMKNAIFWDAIFWDVELCGLNINRRFGGTCRLHLQGRRNNSSLLVTFWHLSSLELFFFTLKMEAPRSSETSFCNKPTQRLIPEYGIPQRLVPFAVCIFVLRSFLEGGVILNVHKSETWWWLLRYLAVLYDWASCFLISATWSASTVAAGRRTYSATSSHPGSPEGALSTSAGTSTFAACSSASGWVPFDHQLWSVARLTNESHTNWMMEGDIRYSLSGDLTVTLTLITWTVRGFKSFDGSVHIVMLSVCLFGQHWQPY
jgi:hypothetical protein